MTDEQNNLPQLPKSWVWTTVGQLYDIVGGGTPSTNISEYWDGDIPWITSADIFGLKDIRPRKYITRIGIENSATNLVPEKSLIVVTRVGLGKLAIAKTPMCFSQDSQALIGNRSLIFPEYSLYYLSKAVQVFKYKHRGTTISGVTKKQLGELPFPLPPFHEQHRIASKIEELFTNLDAGVESLKKVKAQLKRYRQAVLKYAFEGKLTEEWRKTHKDHIEPAQKLLQKIREEKIRKGLGQWKTVDAADVKGLPEIPNNWIWVRAQELCENITNGYTPPSSELHNSSGEIPFIKVNNLTFTGKLDFSKNKTFIDRKLHETMLKRSRVFPGDVLINTVGPPLGKVSIVPSLYPEWNINQAIVFFRPIKGCDKDFLALCLQTNIIMTYLTNQAKATAGQFNISVNMSRNLPIPLPPKEEQEKIVSEVRKSFDAIEHVELLVNEAMSQADYLRSSILKAAFAGTLVPQDPNDEPSEKLLERIKSERTKTKRKSLGSINRKKPNNVEQVELSRYVE